MISTIVNQDEKLYYTLATHVKGGKPSYCLYTFDNLHMNTRPITVKITSDQLKDLEKIKQAGRQAAKSFKELFDVV